MRVLIAVLLLALTPTAAAGKVHWHTDVASWYQLTGSPLGCPPYAPMRAGQVGVAHKSLKCGQKVRIMYRGRKITARVIDRGPFHGNRAFDLSGEVAKRLRFDGVQTIRWRKVR